MHGFERDCVYFDNATTTYMHSSVIKAYQEMNTIYPGSPGRGLYSLANQVDTILADSRKNIKKFFNVSDQGELIFCSGTTAAINMAAFGLRKIIRPGEIILISEIEHNSNFLPWKRLADETHSYLEVIPWKQTKLDYRILDYLSDRKVAVVGITHMSNVTGYEPDLNKIVKFAKTKNAVTLLDIAQTSGHFRFDFNNSGVDLVAVSAHKMYGPKGIGALIGKKEIIEKLEPMNIGGGGLNSIENNKITYRPIPYRHEAGTGNVPGARAWSVACDFLSSNTANSLFKKEKNLMTYIRENLRQIKSLSIIEAEASSTNPIVSFECKNMHSHDLSDYLDTKGIAIRTGNLCAHLYLKALSKYSLNRISVGLYNTKEEADHLLECLASIL